MFSRARAVATFAGRHRQTTIAYVMCRTNDSVPRERNQALLETLFRSQIDSRRFACDYSGECLGVFGRGEFLGLEKYLVTSGVSRRIGVTETVEENNQIAFFVEGDLQNFRCIIQDAQDTNGRSGTDRFAERLIVEADIASGDGRAEFVAGHSQTVNRFAELPHYIRLFRAAEVQAICRR